MRAVPLGADWLTRTAWGLSAAVHAGAVAAALGWGEPAIAPVPQIISVSVVALSPAAGPGGGESLAEETPAGAPPAESGSASTDLTPTPAPPEAAAPTPPPVRAVQPSEPAPPEPEPAAAPERQTEATRRVTVRLPVPSHKPSPPADAAAPAPTETVSAPAAERRAEIEAPAEGSRPQTAALPARPAAPDPARGGSGAGSPGTVERAGPSVAGISNPEPAYPMTSRMRGEEGTVVLEIAVSAAGTVTSVRVVETSGHPRLDRAAAEAVRRWRFAPARIGDQPIDAVIRHPVIFRLDR